jgi:hypothetical protein
VTVQPTPTVADVSVVEGDAGTANPGLRVTVSAASAQR